MHRLPILSAVPEQCRDPRIFELYNQASMYNAVERSRFAYNQWMREEERAELLPPMRRVRGEVPAGDQDHGLAGEGGLLLAG